MNRIYVVGLSLALLTAGGWWLYIQGGVAAREEMQAAQLLAIENMANQYKLKEAKANELRDQALELEKKSLDRAKRLEKELRLVNKSQPACIIDDAVVSVLDEAVRDPAIPIGSNPKGLVAADGTVTSDTLAESRFLAVDAYNKCARKINAIVEHVKTQE